jgi:hypothetical protein
MIILALFVAALLFLICVGVMVLVGIVLGRERNRR